MQKRLGVVAEKGTNGALGELAGFLARLCAQETRMGAGCTEEACEGEAMACPRPGAGRARRRIGVARIIQRVLREARGLVEQTCPGWTA